MSFGHWAFFIFFALASVLPAMIAAAIIGNIILHSLLGLPETLSLWLVGIPAYIICVIVSMTKLNEAFDHADQSLHRPFKFRFKRRSK